MFKRKFMILAIFLVGLLAISAVSAEDNATSDIVATADADEIVEEANDDLNLQESEDNYLPFSELFLALYKDTSEDVYLENDYKYNGTERINLGPEHYVIIDDKGVLINRTLTIHGNGHVIDGAGAARIFNVTYGNVVLKDIVFRNGCSYMGGEFYWSSQGAAIHWTGDDGAVLNCSFTNFYAKREGGAVYWSGSNGALTDCSFKDCYSDYIGGCIEWTGDNGTLSQCSFSNCSSYTNSGIIHWTGNDGAIDGCNFTKQAKNGIGTVRISDGANFRISKSRFINCSGFKSVAIRMESDNGSISECTFINCTGRYVSEWDIGTSTGAIDVMGANGTISNCTFVNCTSEKSGAIYLEGDSDAVSDCNFFNCSRSTVSCSSNKGMVTRCNFVASNTYSAFECRGLNCTMTDCNFTDCNAITHGGGISWENDNGVMMNCNFINCYSQRDGGAISIYNNNNISMIACNFTNCSSEQGGGAIQLRGNGLRVLAGRFVDCHCTSDGGAISWNIFDGEAPFENATVSSCEFINCRCGYYGAAINWNSDYSLIVNCTFTDCRSEYIGGAIRWYGDNGNITNCNFTNCNALADGTAIAGDYDYPRSCDDCIISGCNFYACGDNSCTFYWFGKNSAIIDCNFTECHSDDYGGGIIWNRDNGQIINCNFVNCTSEDGAGAIECSGYYSNITGCSFINCSSTFKAGAILLEAYHIVLSDCEFVNCHSTYHGGAIYSVRPVSVVSSNFTNCSSKYSGGAIYGEVNYSDDFMTGTASDCNFNDCNARDGGALYEINANNCSFTNNRAERYGGAMYECNATDCTFKGNSAGLAGNDVYHYVEGPVLSVSDLTTTYNSGAKLNVSLIEEGKLIDDANITINVYEGYSLIGTYYCLSGNGWVVNLDAGSYIAVCSVEGQKYVVEPVSVELTVNRASYQLTSSAVTTVYNGGKYIVAKLKDSQGKPVKGVKLAFKLSGTKSGEATTDKNGEAKLTANGLAPNTYTATVTFSGDKNHDKTSVDVKVTVKKATVKMTAKAKTLKRSDKTKKYTVTLKTNQNKVMKNTKVTVKVNKKTYTAKTNSKGVATFKLTKLTKKGKYTATVKYAGSKYYNAKSANVKITVK